MKLLSTHISYLLNQHQTRSNLRALLKYLLFLLGVIIVYAVLFHWIMIRVENQNHSYVTGVYWTLTVMSTLGFGDITFHSDIGRLFSIVVLISGIILLLIVLPFAFIRFFYAPWLEAQLRFRAPREVAETIVGHVIICCYETVAQGFIRKLKLINVPYYVIEPDTATAADLYEEGVSVVTGKIDDSATYAAMRASDACMVLANSDDATNTNITLTVREKAPDIPVVAIAEQADSIDILTLAGATHVLPIKQRLGEYLASRVNTDSTNVHVIGTFKDLFIAEFPVQNTPLAGKTIRDTRLREKIGVNVVGLWQRGRLLPVRPDTVLCDLSVPVIVGTEQQLVDMESFLVIYNVNLNPVIVLGCGNVGFAAAGALKKKGGRVHIIERDPKLLARAKHIADDVFLGNAADLDVLMKAGLDKAPSIVITTNDDAMNIYLAVYCRRLNPNLRIVSRITHESNLEAIHRAGADFVLSYASLGAESVFSIFQNRELVVLGEGIDIFAAEVPSSLKGKTLGKSDIGARTGLNVIAIQKAGSTLTNPRADTVLEAGSELLMIGSTEQRESFYTNFVE